MEGGFNRHPAWQVRRQRLDPYVLRLPLYSVENRLLGSQGMPARVSTESTAHLSQRLWTEFSGMTDNAKRKGLGGQKRYYYVFSIGTESEHRGKGENYPSPSNAQLADHQIGLAKAIMHYHQEKAKSENLPIWLEATTESSRHLYLSMGFQEVEQITLGKGKVDAEATVRPGGPGVTLYAMVWWPKSASVGSLGPSIEAP